MHQECQTTQQKTTMMRNQSTELEGFLNIISLGFFPGVCTDYCEIVAYYVVNVLLLLPHNKSTPFVYL